MSKPGNTVFKDGPHKGKTIDEVGSTDEGLLWLDSNVDTLDRGSVIRKAVVAYLKDPVIVAELEELLGDEYDY